MGAHSTFEDHLKGVQAFHAPPSTDELDGGPDKRASRKDSKAVKSSKHKDSTKHKKDKREKKDKYKVKEKKSKQKKDKRRRETPESEHSSSDEDIETQLEKGRAAVRITREILDIKPELRQELRQVLISVHASTCMALQTPLMCTLD